MPTHVDLPEDVWKLVLKHVPLSQRLSSCALVCQKFKAAAVAATERIEATLFEQPAVDHFATYLQQHGIHLTSLILTGDCSDSCNWPQLEQLPCKHLQELQLVKLNLGWGPDGTGPNVLDNATAITRLELHDVNSELNFDLAALSVLPSLQHLCISGFCLIESQVSASDASAFAFCSLQQLTHLDLSSLNLDAESLRHISSITGLHTLHVIDCCDLASATPGLSLPPSLQHLELCNVFEPSLLAAATQLTHLDLNCATVLDEGGVSGGACLLGFLSKLQRLDYLDIFWADCNWPPVSPAYQALVASSSKLRVLNIDRCSVPDEVLALLFPSAPSLVVLPRLEQLGVPRIPPGAVAGVMRCCPALQNLRLGAEAPGCAHLAALSQLSALTRLDLILVPEGVGIDGASTAVTIQYLAGLTRLQELRVVASMVGGMTCTDLLPLTALRQLTELVGSGTLLNKAGPGEPPDVWLQLLERCAGDSACLPSIIRSYARQQQDVTDLQQDVTDLKQHLAEQQRQIVQLQQLAGRQQGQAQQ